MNNQTPSISTQRGKKKLNQNKKLFKKLFFLLLITTLLCNNSFSQEEGEISIKLSSSVKNPVGYGDSILIKEIIIDEGEDTNFIVNKTPNESHMIKLKAPEGFKFSSMTLPESGGDVLKIGFEQNHDPKNKPLEEVQIEFTVSNTTHKDVIKLTNIVLQPTKPYNSNYSYEGKLKIKMILEGSSSPDAIQEFPKSGNYKMVVPEISFSSLNDGCVSQYYSFNLSVDDRHSGNTLSSSDKIVVTYLHSTNSNDNDTLLNEDLGTQNKTIPITELKSDYDKIRVGITYSSGWKMTKELTISNSKTSKIYMGDILPINFIDNHNVAYITIYEGSIPLSNYISDTSRCSYHIEDKRYLYTHRYPFETFFKADVAGVGLHKVGISRIHPESGCETKDTMYFNVIPDIITAKNVYCVGIDTVDTIKIARSAFGDIFPTNQHDKNSIYFYSMQIKGDGGVLSFDFIKDIASTTKEFYNFIINPTELFEKAIDSTLENMIIQINVYSKVKYQYSYKDYTLNISRKTNTKPYGYDYCHSPTYNSKTGLYYYDCYNKEEVIQEKTMKIGTKISQLSVPKNDGWLTEFEPVYCQENKLIELNSNRIVNSINIQNDTNNFIVYDKKKDRYWLDLGVFRSDTNTSVDIDLHYYDANTCSMDSTFITTIHAVPQVKFTADVICEDEPQPFMQISPDSEWVNIKGWSWDFGDGFTLSNFSDTSEVAIPDGSHGGNTTGKFRAPSHFYETPGKKVVALEVMSEQGCKNAATETIVIGKYPSPTFTFSGKLQDRTTTLDNLSGLFPDDSVESYTYTITAPSGKESSHELTNRNDFTFEPEEYGVYTAELTARSGNGCTRSVDTLLPVFPVKEVSTDNFYFEDFTGTDLKGWLPSQSHLRGHEASWEHCAVKGSFKTGTQKEGDMWLAGKPADSIDNEISWLESPCFDLSELTFPMVSMDIFESLENGRDGAALFYTLDDGETWYRVGSTQTGANWYNGEGIFNTPGKTMGKNKGSMGWTKDTTAWVTARHPLDTIRRASLKGGAGCIRFRVAYNSNAFHNKKYEGFAVDNFLIGKRKRIILLEEFINSEYEKAHPNEIKTDFEQLNKFVNSYPDEICDIRYHIQTNYWDDPLLGINKQDNNVRAGHYGAFTWGAMWVMDGAIKSRYGDKVLNNNYQSSFEERGLVDPAFEIFNVQTELEGNKLKITATIKKVSAHLDEKYGKHASHVRYAIVQKEYKDGKGKVHRNVMIDLLPTAPGNVVKTLEGFAVGDEVTLTETWTPEINNIQTPGNKFRLIIFIEAHVKTKEIEQVWFTDLDDFIIPKTTRVKDNKYPESFWEIYPNPVSDKINLAYSQSLTGEIQWSVISVNGQKIKHGKSYINGKGISIPVSDLSGGLYLLQITRADGTLINKAFSKVKD